VVKVSECGVYYVREIRNQCTYYFSREWKWASCRQCFVLYIHSR